ncbi:MAG: hypothetical protein ACI8S6_000293 [Myxococcota bacterium]|jgi:hypothetical protein
MHPSPSSVSDTTIHRSPVAATARKLSSPESDSRSSASTVAIGSGT